MVVSLLSGKPESRLEVGPPGWLVANKNPDLRGVEPTRPSALERLHKQPVDQPLSAELRESGDVFDRPRPLNLRLREPGKQHGQPATKLGIVEPDAELSGDFRDDVVEGRETLGLGVVTAHRCRWLTIDLSDDK
jgi:hypothetical protein